ncbi:DNA polymerase III subunit gamma/tau [Ellagibacter isourolithinifaciens]|uniref:DNA polymerase III subunit gamma/tau n=1 Tax=Ellagibacter isourolithinifaciens TaxID=2137581 RepID=UPI0023EF816D|nr:DNA polymerase III subunit gamma/tau [Ellagibacter isourolithinifaciens]MDD5924858.1 DNA polymerase III subunit gamma/tau [Ellagibacter isourolithinifaciens]
MSEALYRKYRPQTFEDVVGQEHIERTIKNAIEQDKVSHAYLFCGPRGTGKTTTARLLAKALLCEGGPTADPDGTCEDCQLIAAGEHPDVYELDAASRTGVDNVREEIINRVQFAPTRGRYKVYIIDEVHMLSVAAFNALLKTLEEPPSHVVFILATTDPQKVPETIHSRCQRFDFRRISAEAMVARLGAVCVSEGVEFEGEALDLIAHRAEGGLRNALTSLEQIIAFGEGKVTLAGAEAMLGSLDSSEMSEIMNAVGTRDAAACFRWTAQYVETGADLARFVGDMAERVRNLYVMSLVGADVALEVSESERRELTGELPLFGPDRLARLLGVLGDLSAELKTSTNPRLSFEIALTRMVRPDSDLTLEALAERIEALESGYSACSRVIAPAAAPTAAAPAAAVATGAPSSAASEPSARAHRGAASSVGSAMGQAGASFDSRHARTAASETQASQEAASRGAGSPAGGFQASAEAVPVVNAAAATAAAGAAPRENVASAADAVAGASAVCGAIPAELADTLRNEAALQRIWSSAIASLKKSKAAYGVLFLNTKAVLDEGRGMLIIEFPVENAFAFNAVQKPDVQDAVSAALAQSCGAAIPFAFSKGPSQGASAVAAPSASSSGASARSATQQVQPQASHAERPSAAREAAAAAMRAVREREAAAASAEPARSTARQPVSSANARQASPQAREPQMRGAQNTGAFVPEPDPVPLDAYGDAPYDEPVPYGDEDAFVGDASAYAAAPASPAKRRGGGEARRSSAAASSVPDFNRMAREAAARTSAAAGLPPEPTDANTSASIDATGPNGEPAGSEFGSPDDLAAMLAAGGFEGSRVEEVRE